MSPPRIDETPVSFQVRAIRLTQPIGEFFVASIPSKKLCAISYFDVRRMLKERDVETYLGIQRPLSERRVEELEEYVETVDACFPTAVILAIEGRCAEYDEETGMLTLSNDPNPDGELDPVYYRSIAKVLDGQHRIAGLLKYEREDFDVNVSIFVDIDIEDQAYIFSTVNLAQTKVNRSLAYDLFALSKAPSPQRTCHNIAVALDRTDKSPLHHRIKRLGSATPGRDGELITQATFVEALLPFITSDPVLDRDILKRGNHLSRPTASDLDRHPFRDFFVSNSDLKIADILFRYFAAVQERWPTAWGTTERGFVLNRTNGFRALMRALMPIYKMVRSVEPVPSKETFAKLLEKVELRDEDFTSDRFKPGSSGEKDLLHALLTGMKLLPRSA